MASIKQIQGVLFDCDGVLLDSEAIYLKALVQYLASIGYPTTIKEVTFVLGKPMKQIVKDLREYFKIPESLTDQELIDGQRAIFRAQFNTMELQPMDGLLDFLKLCREHGFKTAIVSSSDLSYIEDVVQRLNIKPYFDCMISGQMIEHGKPSPDIYLFAQQRIDLPLDSLIVIEDSPAGIQAGQSAGMFTIGYKGSVVEQNTSKADLEVLNYHQLINQFDELINKEAMS